MSAPRKIELQGRVEDRPVKLRIRGGWAVRFTLHTTEFVRIGKERIPRRTAHHVLVIGSKVNYVYHNVHPGMLLHVIGTLDTIPLRVDLDTNYHDHYVVVVKRLNFLRNRMNLNHAAQARTDRPGAYPTAPRSPRLPERQPGGCQEAGGTDRMAGRSHDPAAGRLPPAAHHRGRTRAEVLRYLESPGELFPEFLRRYAPGNRNET